MHFNYAKIKQYNTSQNENTSPHKFHVWKLYCLIKKKYKQIFILLIYCIILQYKNIYKIHCKEKKHYYG